MLTMDFHGRARRGVAHRERHGQVRHEGLEPLATVGGVGGVVGSSITFVFVVGLLEWVLLFRVEDGFKVC